MEIDLENLKNIKIKDIVLNKDQFGPLIFDRSYPFLKKLQDEFIEFDDLNFGDLLTSPEIQDVINYKKQLVNYIKRIDEIHPDLGVEFNKNIRDQIENEIESFYGSTTRELRPKLVYLRQEAARSGQDASKLEEQQKATIQAEQQYKKLIESLEKKVQDFNKQEKEFQDKKRQVEIEQNQLGAVRLAKHFELEVARYEKKAKDWQIAGFWGYGIIIILLISSLIYVFLIKGDLTLQQGITKLIMFGALWYGLSFIIKNLNINSHLAAVNRHRAAVARTLEDFFETNLDKQEALKNATEAMFKNYPVGYLRKTEKDATNPILEIINNMPGLKSND